MKSLTRTVFLLMLAATACSHTIPAITVVPVKNSAVALNLLPDPNASQAHPAPGEEFSPPQLYRENPLPVYPAGLLPLNLGRRYVVLRVLFDESGLVGDILNSPIARSTQDIYTPSFEEAAREAVLQWRCSPPQIRKFRQEHLEDGTSYSVLVRETRFKTFFDIQFSFEVVEGKPVVKH